MTRRCILGVFAHPDDETSGAGATFTKYAREGVEVYVATATRGEQGALGSGGLAIAREKLPAVREGELRTVLQMYGAHPPILLGYKDQELMNVDFEELVKGIAAVMAQVKPDVVITFGPLGISRHDDHISIHKATVEAFHRYPRSESGEPRLFYTAIPKEIADQFQLNLEGPEVEPTVAIDIKEHKAVKIQALRTYRSQEDAQWLASVLEQAPFEVESFHQAYPPVPDGWLATGFWE